jgi:hypothetical protein
MRGTRAADRRRLYGERMDPGDVGTVTDLPAVCIAFPAAASSLAADLREALEIEYGPGIAIATTSFADLTADVERIAGSDLLVFLFDGSGWTDEIRDAIARRHDQNGPSWALPVALDPAAQKPPAPLSGIHARTMPGERDKIITRIGSLLGLRLCGGQKVFLSYRAIDGIGIARQLYEALAQQGIAAFLDTAEDEFGNLTVELGEPIQKRIREWLEDATAVVLIDTPALTSSEWIRREIDMAIGAQVPVFPVVWRTPGDPSQGPRFRNLLDLRRWANVSSGSVSGQPCSPDRALDPADLARVVDEIERYLRDLAQFRLRVRVAAQRAFQAAGYSWTVVEERRRMFSAVKPKTRTRTAILSHCALQSPEFVPALKALHLYPANEHFTRRAYVYGGWVPVFDPAELVTKAELREGEVDLLHVSEIRSFLEEV